MIRWALQHIVWFMIRLVVTFACLVTIKNVAHRQGLYITYETLLISSVCLIVGVRMWMPRCEKEDSITQRKVE